MMEYPFSMYGLCVFEDVSRYHVAVSTFMYRSDICSRIVLPVTLRLSFLARLARLLARLSKALGYSLSTQMFHAKKNR